MRYVYSAFVMVMLILAPLPAQADMVLHWNEYALQTIRDASSAPPVASRALAITHAAIYDSVNSIYKTNQILYSATRIYQRLRRSRGSRSRLQLSAGVISRPGCHSAGQL